MDDELENIRIISDVAVSTNDATVGRACSAYPVCDRADSGLLACAYRAGSKQHSDDGQGVVQTSTDQGQTWSKPAVVFDGRDFDPPESLVSLQIVAAADGSLLVLFPAVVCTAPDKDMMDTEEGMAQERRYYRVRSRDDGRTWTEPERISFGVPRNGLSGRSFRLPSGELFINTPYWPREGVRIGGGCFSSDHGQTFSPIVDFHSMNTADRAYDEAYYTTFDDGEILALYWTWKQDTDNLKILRINETVPVHRSISRDSGRSWSDPEPTNLAGQLTSPLALDSTTVIAASNYRRDPAGIRLWISRDRGVSFDTDPIQLWDAGQERVIATPVSSLAAPQVNAEDHRMESFTFGLPDLTDLKDDTCLLTYYATIEENLHIRACRFALT